MRPTDILVTKRLILRPLRMADALVIQRIFPRWYICRYLSAVPWPYPRDGAVDFLRRNVLGGMKKGTHWVWAITLKGGDGALVGVINLRKDKKDIHRGFWISPALQGRGLMTEAVIAVNDFAFSVAGIKKLKMLNAKANRGSRRIKEITGGRLIGRGRQRFVCGMLPTEIWELTKENWLAHRN